MNRMGYVTIYRPISLCVSPQTIIDELSYKYAEVYKDKPKATLARFVCNMNFR